MLSVASPERWSVIWTSTKLHVLLETCVCLSGTCALLSGLCLTVVSLRETPEQGRARPGTCAVAPVPQGFPFPVPLSRSVAAGVGVVAPGLLRAGRERYFGKALYSSELVSGENVNRGAVFGVNIYI